MRTKKIRLTQEQFEQLIEASTKIIVEELSRQITEDGIGGGGATNSAGVMQGGGTNPESGQYTVPAFGGNMQRRKIYSPKKKHKGQVNNVDMGPALDRSGGKNKSISVNRDK